MASCKVVLIVGRTGAGKSSLANTIIGRPGYFKIGETLGSVTNVKSLLEGSSHDGRVKVFDSIGIGDTGLSHERVAESIAETVQETRDGIDVVIFAIPCGRFTQNDTDMFLFVVDHLLGRGVLNNLYFVFTRASERLVMGDDALRREFLQEHANLGPPFAEIWNEMGRNVRRFVFVDNPDPNSTTREDVRRLFAEQVTHAQRVLLKIIDGFMGARYHSSAMEAARAAYAKSVASKEAKRQLEQYALAEQIAERLIGPELERIRDDGAMQLARQVAALNAEKRREELERRLEDGQAISRPADDVRILVDAEWTFSAGTLKFESTVLGIGALGEVRAATLHGTPVAAKTLHLAKSALLSDEEKANVVKQLLTECAFLRRMLHPNIVGFMGVAVDDERRPLWLVTERLVRSLHDALHGSGEHLAVDQEIPVLRDLLRALAFLHAQLFIHRDIKSTNVLLDAHGLAKLCDLGEGKLVSAVSRTAHVGTPPYMAPEMKDGDCEKTPAVDVFSFGVLIAEVSSRMRPVPGSERRLLPDGRQVLISEVERYGKLLEAMRNPDLRSVATICITDNPALRPTAAVLLPQFEVLSDARNHNEAQPVAQRRRREPDDGGVPDADGSAGAYTRSKRRRGSTTARV